MMYFITYVTYGNNKKNISINIHDNIHDAEREAQQLKACGHKHIRIRTDLYNEYMSRYKEIA